MDTEPTPAPSTPSQRDLRWQYAQLLYAATCGPKGCREPYFGYVRPVDPTQWSAYVCGPHPEPVICAVRRAADAIDWDATTAVFDATTGTMIFPPEA